MKTATTHALKTIALAAALSLPVMAGAQQPTQQKAPPAAESTAKIQQMPIAVLASDYIGKKVVNARGQDLGEVQDLAIDMHNNRVYYAMLDMQNKMFAYPMRALSMTADNRNVLLNVSEERLEKAPGMDSKGNWDKRTGTVSSDYGTYWRDVDSYWNDRPASTTGATVKPQARADQQLVWASKLIGWNVHNRANNDSIGEVKDLVIQPRDGMVKFAAVDFNDKIGGADRKMFNDKLHALPLDAFDTRDGKDDLVLNADVAKMKAAQGFDENQLERSLGDKSFIDRTSRYADDLTTGKSALR